MDRISEWLIKYKNYDLEFAVLVSKKWYNNERVDVWSYFNIMDYFQYVLDGRF